MATSTYNYGLIKPGLNDLYGDFIPGIFGANMSAIDTELARLAKIAGVEITPITAADVARVMNTTEVDNGNSDT